MKTSQKMTTAKLKRGVSFFLAMIMLFSVIPVQAITVQAEVKTTAFSQISSSKVMKTHTITTGKTIPYTSTDLKTRGTQNKPSKTAYISGSDDLYVYKVGTDSKGKLYAKVSYPVGKTRYYAYIPLSAITSSNSTHKKTTATGKASTYLRSNGSGGSSSMYITKGDTVYLIATSGSYYQIMYNLSGNKAWRLAWITKSNYNKYCTDSSSSKTNTNTNTKTNSITVKGYISENKTGNITISSTSSSYLNKVKEFLSTSYWKNGAKWNSSKLPVKSNWVGYGCCAYAADFCYYVYNNNSPNTKAYQAEINDIKTGDVLYFQQKPHYIIVLQRDGNKLITAEGSASSKVCVSSCKYTIKNNTLKMNDKDYSTTVRITRYGI